MGINKTEIKKELEGHVKSGDTFKAIDVYNRCFEQYISKDDFFEIDKFVRNTNFLFYLKIGLISKKILLMRISRGRFLYILDNQVRLKQKESLKDKQWTVESDPSTHEEIEKRKKLKRFFLSWTDKEMKRFRNLKNKHKNKKCFIVCTGPSLTIEDLEKLKGEITFGVNTITDAYPRTTWRPTYYVVVDHLAYKEKLSKNPIYGGRFALEASFFSKKIEPLTKSDNDYFLLLNLRNHEPDYLARNKIKASKDISVCVYDCFTVANTAIQIAIYMGFKTIYLVGVDCNYDNSKIHFIEHENDQKWIREGWLPNATLLMIKGFEGIKKIAKKRGVKIYNATKGGKLEVFERVNFNSLL